jgi:hypothetical protein
MLALDCQVGHQVYAILDLKGTNGTFHFSPLLQQQLNFKKIQEKKVTYLWIFPI